MGLSDALTSFGIFVACVSAVATIASLSTEGRTRLIEWSHGIILWVAFVTTTGVLIMFALRPGQPPRWEILLAIFYVLAWIWTVNQVWIRYAPRETEQDIGPD